MLISMPVLHNAMMTAAAIAEQLSAITGLLISICNDGGNGDRMLKNSFLRSAGLWHVSRSVRLTPRRS